MPEKENQNDTLAQEIVAEITNAQSEEKIRDALLEGMFDAAPEEEKNIKNNKSILESVDKTAKKIWQSKKDSNNLKIISKETEQLFKNTGNKLKSSKLLNVAKAIAYFVVGMLAAIASVQADQKALKKAGKGKGFGAIAKSGESKMHENTAQKMFRKAAKAWKGDNKGKSFVEKLKSQRTRRESGKGK